MADGLRDDAKNEVLRRTDLVALVGESIPLKQSGRNFWGLCPFHEEKTPSFSVNPDKRIFYCFGCGEGGDAFSWLMRTEGMTFPEALEELARRTGVELPQRGRPDPGAARRKDLRERMKRVTERAETFFREMLQNQRVGAGAREYLERRCISAASIETFRLGYAPEGWSSLSDYLRGEGEFDEEALVSCGLARRRESGGVYDGLRDRVVFPITNPRGQTIGFGGRLLGEEVQGPKYINSPQSALYDKGRTAYGLSLAQQAMRDSGEVIVVEGYFDVIAMHQLGFANTVAPLGTALTPEQIDLLSRNTHHKNPRFIMFFDNDPAGLQAALKVAKPFVERGIMPRIAIPPSGKDSADLLLVDNNEAGRMLKDAITNASPLIEMYIAQSLTGEIRSPEEKLAVIDDLKEIFLAMKDHAQRETNVYAWSKQLQIDQRLVWARLKKSARDAIRHNKTPAAVLPEHQLTTTPTEYKPEKPSGNRPYAYWERSAEVYLLGLLLYEERLLEIARQLDIGDYLAESAVRVHYSALIGGPADPAEASGMALLDGIEPADLRRVLMGRVLGDYYEPIREQPDGLARDYACCVARIMLTRIKEEFDAVCREGDRDRLRRVIEARNRWERLLQDAAATERDALLLTLNGYIQDTRKWLKPHQNGHLAKPNP